MPDGWSRQNFEILAKPDVCPNKVDHPRVRSRRNLHSARFEPYLILFFLSWISYLVYPKNSIGDSQGGSKKDGAHTWQSGITKIDAVSYPPVQVFKIAYYCMFHAVHQRNAILQNVTYALLHPTDFCEISRSHAGPPYYEPHIQVSLQKCPWWPVMGFWGLITQSEQIWIIWGLIMMCSSEEILHFFLYPWCHPNENRKFLEDFVWT